MTHGHSLNLIVGDVGGGNTETSLKVDELGAGLHTKLCVEVRERLIHQEHLGFAHDCAPHGDTLALTTRESLGLTVEIRRQIEDLRCLLNTLLAVVLGNLLLLERKAHILADRHLRIERVVLENHRNVAILRAHKRYVTVVNDQTAFVDRFEASEHSQRGRLSRSRWPDEYQEFAVGDVQVELVNCANL